MDFIQKDITAQRNNVSSTNIIFDSYSVTTNAIADKYLRFDQNLPSDTWMITHNLNKYPSVTVVDSAGTVVIGAISYTDLNSLIVTFSSGFSGSANLN